MEMIKSAVPLIPRSTLIGLERFAIETVPIERAIQRIRLARTIAEEVTDTDNMIPMGLQEVPSPPVEIPSPKPKRKVRRKLAGFRIPGPVTSIEKGIGRDLEVIGHRIPKAQTVRAVERLLPALEHMEPAIGRFTKHLPRSGKVDQALVEANVARSGYEGLPGEEQKTAAPITRLLKAIPKPMKLDPHLIGADVARQGANAVLPEDKKIPGVQNVLSSKLSEYRARVQLQKFAGIASPKPYAIWLMQKQAFIGALLARGLGFLARGAARVAPRLARPFLGGAARLAPNQFATKILPRFLESPSLGRVAVQRFGGNVAPVLQKALPKAMQGGRLAAVQTTEQAANAAKLLRGSATAQAQQRLLGKTLTPAVQRPFATAPTMAGQSPAQAIQAAQASTAGARASAQVGQQAAQTGKASFMDIGKNYFKPETWAKGWAAPGAKLNFAMTAGLGVMSGQNPLEAGVGAAAAIPFSRAGFIPGLAASLGAGALASKFLGNQQPAATPPPPVAEAPAPQMPEPMPMPMTGGYAPPPPPMFQPGFRG